MASVFEFKYADVDHQWKSVAVAGSFNDWSTERTKLAFDPSTKTWAKHVELDVSPMTKLYYKYVLNGQEWVLDDAPHTQKETDEHGNVNNIAFTTFQKVATAKTSYNEDRVEETGEHSNGNAVLPADKNGTDGCQESTSPLEESLAVKAVNTNAQHVAPLGTSSKQQAKVVNGSPEAGAQTATSQPNGAQNNEQSAINLKDSQPEVAKPSETLDTGSWNVWKYIKWFFQYYIFSLFTSS